MSKPADAIPDELILAAVDRAVRHGGRERAAITGAIYDHLNVPSRSGGARHVYRRLPSLEVAGALERSRRFGLVVWSLTSAGRRRLNRARRAGTVELPESPQHRAWRTAQALAAQEIERFCEELRDRLTEGMELVDSESRSDPLFEIAHRLHFECRRLASVTYCLEEWTEPDDAQVDIDEYLEPAERKLPDAERAHLRSIRAGRRNFRSWQRCV